MLNKVAATCHYRYSFSSRDFSIAFLAASPNLSLRERIASWSWKHYGRSTSVQNSLYPSRLLFVIFALICYHSLWNIWRLWCGSFTWRNTQNGNDAGLFFFGDTPALLRGRVSPSSSGWHLGICLLTTSALVRHNKDLQNKNNISMWIPSGTFKWLDS